ncbi:MAG: rhodanese-like domain-containing protein [Elainella sp.]
MTSTRPNPVQNINPHALKQGLEQQILTLIDVREPAEYAREHIAGAQSMPLSRFDPKQISAADQAQLVLYCQSGRRSATAAEKLLAAGFESVLQLEGGLAIWKEAGYATVINRNAPISLMRQVQIVAGALVFTGTLLGAFVSPWFLLLSGFVGTGLMIAGLTNTCMLARLLAQLPYNQRSIL